MSKKSIDLSKNKKQDFDRPRGAAARLVQYVTTEDSFGNLIYDEVCESFGLKDLDRSFALAIYKGTIFNLVNIDAIIESTSKIKLEVLQPVIIAILRTAVWQIMYSDKIPEHAICDESVKVAKAFSNSGAASYTNGVLRNIIRNKDELKDKFIENPVKFHLKCSMPPELSGYFKKWFGPIRAIEICKSLHSSPDTTFRVNGLKENSLTVKKISCRPASFIPNAFIATEGTDFSQLSEFIRGEIAIQDEAAMLSSIIANPSPGDFVIDLCSAPGGKTCHMADLMNNSGRIIACDISNSRIKLTKENVNRLGVKIVEHYEGDASLIKSDDLGFEKPDIVLADVPCSGLGVIRRKPDIMIHMTHEKIISLYELQGDILQNASNIVKLGGFILYSTCTLNPEENENRIMKFLKNNNKNFELVDISGIIPDSLKNIDEGIIAKAKSGMITLFPDKHGCDGFFISKLRKIK